MIKISIEKNVPIPKGRGNEKFPTAQLLVGDSFFVPSSQATTCAAFYKTAREHGMKVTVRSQPNGGFRVWRTAYPTQPGQSGHSQKRNAQC